MKPFISRNNILLGHFFRRFFDNDTLQTDGDTTTTIARALAVVTAPGMLVAFFLQNQYPAPPLQRPLWGRIEDQYFFVLLSFVVMGAVTIFEWEMLFPDRLDFLVLTPLPLMRGQIMIAKAFALIGFLLLFLTGTNLMGAFIFPAICKGPFVHQLLAHTAAVMLAGIFSSCAILSIVSLLRCCLPDRFFRAATPLVQAVLTAALVLLVIQYARYSDSIKPLLASGSTAAHFIPTFWFLGVYDRLLYGPEAPSFASDFASIACYASAACLAFVCLLYPLTWARMQKMSIEGALSRTSSPIRSLQRWMHAVIRQPAQRGMFHFLGQTIRRSPRYQIYLAMYAGTGFSLAAACAFVLRSSRLGVVPVASLFGSHAVVPLLIFWTIAGLHTAFAFPADLSARWIFRVSGADSRDLVTAAWRWVLAVASGVWAVALLSLLGLNWSRRALAVQLVYGLCLGLVLTDAFFFARRVPLIKPRLPGRSNFALFLTLYIGVLSPAMFGIIWSEIRSERSPWLLLPVVVATLAFHLAFRQVLSTAMEEEEQMEGYEGEFQVLNLG